MALALFVIFAASVAFRAVAIRSIARALVECWELARDCVIVARGLVQSSPENYVTASHSALLHRPIVQLRSLLRFM